MDMRQYVSQKAAPGQKFRVLLPGNVHVADGSWLEVEPSHVKAQVKGKVPAWIPVIGGKEFEVQVTVTPQGGQKARVQVSGSVAGDSTGPYTHPSADEIKISGLELFKNLPLPVSDVSLTRWKAVETRASVKVSSFPFWIETWWAPTAAQGADEGTGDYPPFRMAEGE